MIAGPSGSGKSTLAAGLIERLIEKEYQVCVIDPEGDYGSMQNVVTWGNQRSPSSVNEVLSILEDPKINLSVNLLGIPLGERPGVFAQLIPGLYALRTRTGRSSGHKGCAIRIKRSWPGSWGAAPLLSLCSRSVDERNSSAMCASTRKGTCGGTSSVCADRTAATT